MDYAGINKSIYFDFIDSLKFKILYKHLFIDLNDNIYAEPTYENYEQIENYKLLQYDILYGEQYIKEWELLQNNL